MKQYDTLLEALKDLEHQGYTYDYNLRQDCLYCSNTEKTFKPNEFEIKATYRFENMSDPAENAVLYAVESREHAIKGTLVNAWGIYSDALSDALLAKF